MSQNNVQELKEIPQCETIKDIFKPFCTKIDELDTEEQQIVKARGEFLERILEIVNKEREQKGEKPATIEQAMVDPGIQKSMLKIYKKLPKKEESAVLLAEEIIQKSKKIKSSMKGTKIDTEFMIFNDTLQEVCAAFHYQIDPIKSSLKKINTAQAVARTSHKEYKYENWFSPREMAEQLFQRTIEENIDAAFQKITQNKNVEKKWKQLTELIKTISYDVQDEDLCELGKKMKGKGTYPRDREKISPILEEIGSDYWAIQKGKTGYTLMEACDNFLRDLKKMPKGIECLNDIEKEAAEFFEKIAIPQAKKEVSEIKNLDERIAKATYFYTKIHDLVWAHKELNKENDSFLRSILQQAMREMEEKYVLDNENDFYKKKINRKWPKAAKADEKNQEGTILCGWLGKIKKENKGEKFSPEDIKIFIALQKFLATLQVEKKMSLLRDKLTFKSGNDAGIFTEALLQHFTEIVTEMTEDASGGEKIFLLRRFVDFCTEWKKFQLREHKEPVEFFKGFCESAISETLKNPDIKKCLKALKDMTEDLRKIGENLEPGREELYDREKIFDALSEKKDTFIRDAFQSEKPFQAFQTIYKCAQSLKEEKVTRWHRGDSMMDNALGIFFKSILGKMSVDKIEEFKNQINTSSDENMAEIWDQCKAMLNDDKEDKWIV